MGKTRKTKLIRLADAKRRTLGFDGPNEETLVISQYDLPA
ncbi:hypothetical protein E1H18_1083 [Caulobacter sp. RHG1]|nr:hypothetical protein [Caulobacter sp. RHG1]